jgi:hypothetical protein
MARPAVSRAIHAPDHYPVPAHCHANCAYTGRPLALTTPWSRRFRLQVREIPCPFPGDISTATVQIRNRKRTAKRGFIEDLWRFSRYEEARAAPANLFSLCQNSPQKPGKSDGLWVFALAVLNIPMRSLVEPIPHVLRSSDEDRNDENPACLHAD